MKRLILSTVAVLVFGLVASNVAFAGGFGGKGSSGGKSNSGGSSGKSVHGSGHGSGHGHGHNDGHNHNHNHNHNQGHQHNHVVVVHKHFSGFQKSYSGYCGWWTPCFSKYYGCQIYFDPYCGKYYWLQNGCYVVCDFYP